MKNSFDFHCIYQHTSELSGLIYYPSDVKLYLISKFIFAVLRFSRNFVDITGNSVDTEAEKFLATLRDTLLPEKIAESNVGRFEVEWSGREGLDKETHTEYLTEFCENFHSRITELVDRAVVAKEKLCSDAMYSETLQHLHMCNTFCKLFQVCWNSHAIHNIN